MEKYPEEQANLLKEIEDTKTANALIEATLRGLHADKTFINELREQNEEAIRAAGEEEEEEEEAAQEEEGGEEMPSYGEEDAD